jgi:hypothetical protein
LSQAFFLSSVTSITSSIHDCLLPSDYCRVDLGTSNKLSKPFLSGVDCRYWWSRLWYKSLTRKRFTNSIQ